MLINLYYNPFDPQNQCRDSQGLNAAKETALTGLLNALNGVLSNGAKAASDLPVQPDFTGHALCDPDPYVQGASPTMGTTTTPTPAPTTAAPRAPGR